MDDELQVERIPDLHDPVALVAFSGWNDAASSATDAARYVVERLNARRFATIAPDRFYAFTDSRPSAAIARDGTRSITWQKNEFYYARVPDGPHDIIISIGAEPNLRWKTFTSAHLGLYRQLKAGLVVSVGALLADVPHTRPVRVTGTALDPDVAARLDLTTSRYEGPTGIVGVLHDALRREGVPAASLWANTPHYVTTSQNPNATRALLVRLRELLEIRLDLRDLEASGERFVREVNTALSVNTEVAAYVRKLEEAYDSGAPEPEDGELPEAHEVIGDVEDFLRGLRDD